jgi:hypothetical protein
MKECRTTKVFSMAVKTNGHAIGLAAVSHFRDVHVVPTRQRRPCLF